MKTKQCCVCKKRKALSLFAKNKKRKDGTASECLVCHRVYRRNHYHQNKVTEKLRATNRKREITKWLNEFKATLKCEVCSESDPVCLDFHHKNPKQKTLPIARCLADGWGQSRLLSEIKKCKVLCSNCHRKLHFKRV